MGTAVTISQDDAYGYIRRLITLAKEAPVGTFMHTLGKPPRMIEHLVPASKYEEEIIRNVFLEMKPLNNNYKTINYEQIKQ